MTVRQLGVEEELILVDPSGAPSAGSAQILAACSAIAPDLEDVALVQEFFQAQVEIVTAPARRLADIATRLRRGRSVLAQAAAGTGLSPIAVGGPVVDAPNGPLVPSERFERIGHTYAGVASDSLMCALQVHVEVEDRDEGVGVIDRVRPWVPLLLALSANSPFWHGRDTGFASWRFQVWNMWPSAGPKELFGDLATYDAFAAQMVTSGAVLDVGLLNLDVRLSARYPTVEFRVADVCTSVDDALLVAALCRALTETAAQERRQGIAPAPWRVDQLRAGAWRAARFGLDDTLLSPVDGTTVPASAALSALLRHTAPALAETGDLEFVTAAVERRTELGTGARRQRRAFAQHGDLACLVEQLGGWTLD